MVGDFVKFKGVMLCSVYCFETESAVYILICLLKKRGL